MKISLSLSPSFPPPSPSPSLFLLSCTHVCVCVRGGRKEENPQLLLPPLLSFFPSAPRSCSLSLSLSLTTEIFLSRGGKSSYLLAKTSYLASLMTKNFPSQGEVHHTCVRVHHVTCAYGASWRRVFAPTMLAAMSKKFLL